MRNDKGQFTESGNLSGRPKGIKDRRTVLRQQLDEHGDALLKVAVDMALQGDPQSLRLCLERIMPPIKSTADPISFDLEGESLTEQAQSVLQAVSKGEVDPENGRKLLSAIADVGRIQEVDELAARLEQLEKHLLQASRKP